jgi:hypothetical protein
MPTFEAFSKSSRVVIGLQIQLCVERSARSRRVGMVQGPRHIERQADAAAVDVERRIQFAGISVT